MNLKNRKTAINRIGFLMSVTVLATCLLSNSGILHAQVTDSLDETIENPKTYALDSPIEVKDPKEIEREEFLSNIKAELRATQKELYDVNSNILESENRIDEVHEEITTLSGQLSNLNQQILNTENLIKNVHVQITEKENHLKVLYGDIELKEIEVSNQKNMLIEYLMALYEHESAISDTFSENENINIAKLLLSEEPISEQLQQIKYLNILEQTGHQIFDRLEILIDELEQEKKYADEQRIKLTYLYHGLEEEMHNLELQKGAKENLLEQTRGEETVFAEMIEESRMQQMQIQEDIKELIDALKFIQEKMEELGDDFDPEDYKSIFSGEKISVYEYINSTKDIDFVDFDWPVNPSGGISAYFRDSSYAAVFGVRHNAIDIRVAQETMIRAPADGVVYKVRDNGYGYSYLILAHEGGYMTVYGHIPQFLVEPGEKVFKGQPIALSGGIPGTKGAGLMTTGAHLHFEIMKGGSYVDPLFYLPLDKLPYDSLPEKYTAFVTHEPPGEAMTFLDVE